MPLKFFDKSAADSVGDELARRLLAAAVLGVSEYQKRVSTSAGPYRVKRKRTTRAGARGSTYTAYGNPSKPGEYPHLRTGIGQAGTAYEPTTVEGVKMADYKIRVGVTEAARYMTILELFRKRKGILDTFEDMKDQLRAVITRKGA